MANSRRVPNINGAANSYLKAASKKDGAASQFSAAAKSAPKAQQQLVQNVLNAVRAAITDSDVYQMDLDSRTADVVLGRIASLLDEVKDKFVATELAEAKEEILDEIRGLSIESILKNFLLSQIAELFDDDAKKEDIEDLKKFIQDELAKVSNTREIPSSEDEIPNNQQKQKETPDDDSGQTFKDKEADSLKDESEGEYKDSTIAANFAMLQNVIQQQIDQLNQNIAAIPGGIGLGNVGKMIGVGIKRTLGAVGKLGNKIGSFAKRSLAGIANVSKFLAGGAFKGIAKTLGFIKNGIGKVGKFLVGGAFKGITKTLGFIKNGIGKVGSLVGKVAGGIGKGFKAIGAGIKGIGSKVGGAILHPFKAIGGFFSRRKKDKTAERKENMREKFMNFITGMVEKIWNFVEPILMKLKIFMLVALVPILTTALTVLAIIAAVTLVVVALVMAYMWVKNKLIPKIKALWDKVVTKLKQWWTITKAWFVGLWEGFKEGLKAIWDGIVYIVSFKWLVDFGKWIWKKLVEFGRWLYIEFIYPWIVAPIELLRNKLAAWLTPIMNKLQPFIESAQNLFARLKSIWQKFQWDENKSFFENLKCLASIVKDAVLDWWNTSPFKTFYETYLDPIIKSIQDLIGRIKSIWVNFNWDENKSFVDNLMSFWNNVKTAIQDWWKSSPIKVYWDKLVAYVQDLLKPLREWYDNSALKTWIDKIINWISEFSIVKIATNVINWLSEKLAAITIPMPKMHIEWKEIGIWKATINIPIPKITVEDWKPFSGIAPSQEQTNDIQQQMPMQQVQNALGPVNSLNNMNADNNVELQKTGEEMSNKVAAAEQATEEYRQQQSLIGSQSLSRFNDLEKKLDKYGNDPAVVPMYIPTGQEQNAMPMKGF